MTKDSITKSAWTVSALAIFLAVVWPFSGAIYHDPVAAMYMAMMGLGLGVIISREFGSASDSLQAGKTVPVVAESDQADETI